MTLRSTGHRHPVISTISTAPSPATFDTILSCSPLLDHPTSGLTAGVLNGQWCVRDPAIHERLLRIISRWTTYIIVEKIDDGIVACEQSGDRQHSGCI
jgi:hypothetical protein